MTEARDRYEDPAEGATTGWPVPKPLAPPANPSHHGSLSPERRPISTWAWALTTAAVVGATAGYALAWLS